MISWPLRFGLRVHCRDLHFVEIALPIRLFRNALAGVSSLKRLEKYPDVLNAHMIAQFLNIGYVKALNLIKYGGIPYIKIGNTYRVAKRNFETWLMDSESRVVSF